MAREKELREKFNLKREIKMAPGYIIVLFWVLFTFVLLGWVLAASFSTTPDIFQGKTLKFPTGLHFENYAKAWSSQSVSVIFMNSLGYSIISCVLLVLICAPAAYALSRFDFKLNKAI